MLCKILYNSNNEMWRTSDVVYFSTAEVYEFEYGDMVGKGWIFRQPRTRRDFWTPWHLITSHFPAHPSLQTLVAYLVLLRLLHPHYPCIKVSSLCLSPRSPFSIQNDELHEFATWLELQICDTLVLACACAHAQRCRRVSIWLSCCSGTLIISGSGSVSRHLGSLLLGTIVAYDAAA